MSYTKHAFWGNLNYKREILILRRHSYIFCKVRIKEQMRERVLIIETVEATPMTGFVSDSTGRPGFRQKGTWGENEQK